MPAVNLVTGLLLGGLLLARAAHAGQSAAPPSASAESDAGVDLPFAFDGPPPPVAPAVITRDAAGRATIRAVRLTSPLRLDGQLDEAVYEDVPPISDFIQIEPHAGEPATQKTEVWVMFDRSHVYVTVRCWESHPERMIVNEMRRDNATSIATTTSPSCFDTFYDRRNGVSSSINADRRPGRRADHQRAAVQHRLESGLGGRDRPVRRRLDGRSSRSRSSRSATGRAARRSGASTCSARTGGRTRSRISSPMPASLGSRGVMQISLAPTLVGLEAPPGSKNLEIKPYVVVEPDQRSHAAPPIVERPRRRCRARREIRHHAEPDGRLHLQHRLRPGRSRRAAGQPHAVQPVLPGEARVLSREPGHVRVRRRRDQRDAAGASDTPILFYSRRIGLHENRAVPIDAGGRLTGPRRPVHARRC